MSSQPENEPILNYELGSNERENLEKMEERMSNKSQEQDKIDQS